MGEPCDYGHLSYVIHQYRLIGADEAGPDSGPATDGRMDAPVAATLSAAAGGYASVGVGPFHVPEHHPPERWDDVVYVMFAAARLSCVV